jgi:hypothetical protein
MQQRHADDCTEDVTGSLAAAINEPDNASRPDSNKMADFKIIPLAVIDRQV